MQNKEEMQINLKMMINPYSSKREKEIWKIQAILVSKKLKEIIKIKLI